MWPFTKKNNNEKVLLKDKDLLQECLTLAEVCEHLLMSNEEYQSRLVEIQHRLKYMAPSRSDAAYAASKKIKNKLEDLKTILNSRRFNRISDYIFDIETLVIQREGM